MKIKCLLGFHEYINIGDLQLYETEYFGVYFRIEEFVFCGKIRKRY